MRNRGFFYFLLLFVFEFIGGSVYARDFDSPSDQKWQVQEAMKTIAKMNASRQLCEKATSCPAVINQLFNDDDTGYGISRYNSLESHHREKCIEENVKHHRAFKDAKALKDYYSKHFAKNVNAGQQAIIEPCSYGNDSFDRFAASKYYYSLGRLENGADQVLDQMAGIDALLGKTSLNGVGCGQTIFPEVVEKCNKYKQQCKPDPVAAQKKLQSLATETMAAEFNYDEGKKYEKDLESQIAALNAPDLIYAKTGKRSSGYEKLPELSEKLSQLKAVLGNTEQNYPWLLGKAYREARKSGVDYPQAIQKQLEYNRAELNKKFVSYRTTAGCITGMNGQDNSFCQLEAVKKTLNDAPPPAPIDDESPAGIAANEYLSAQQCTQAAGVEKAKFRETANEVLITGALTIGTVGLGPLVAGARLAMVVRGINLTEKAAKLAMAGADGYWLADGAQQAKNACYGKQDLKVMNAAKPSDGNICPGFQSDLAQLVHEGDSCFSASIWASLNGLPFIPLLAKGAKVVKSGAEAVKDIALGGKSAERLAKPALETSTKALPGKNILATPEAKASADIIGNISETEIRKNSRLATKQARVAKFDEYRQQLAKKMGVEVKPLTDAQKKAINDAHFEPGDLFALKPEDIRRRVKLLKKAGLQPAEIRLGMATGIFGTESAVQRISVPRCEGCETNMQIVDFSRKHSEAHFLSPGKNPLENSQHAMEKARNIRTSVFGDGISLDEVMVAMKKPISIQPNEGARSLLNANPGKKIEDILNASGEKHLGFDAKLKIRGQDYEVRVVTCEVPVCAKGNQVLHKGDVVTVFPLCGPSVYVIPELASLRSSVPAKVSTKPCVNRVSVPAVQSKGTTASSSTFDEAYARGSFSDETRYVSASDPKTRKSQNYEILSKDNDGKLSVKTEKGNVVKIDPTELSIKPNNAAKFYFKARENQLTPAPYTVVPKINADSVFQEAYQNGNFAGDNKYISVLPKGGGTRESVEIIGKEADGRLLARNQRGETVRFSATDAAEIKTSKSAKFLFEDLDRQVKKRADAVWENVGGREKYSYPGKRASEKEMNAALIAQPKAAQKIAGMYQDIRKIPLEKPVKDFKDIPRGKTHIGDPIANVTNADPRIAGALKDAYNLRNDSEAMAVYWRELMKDTAAEMKKSKVPRVQKAFANGEIDYDTAIKVLSDRARARGEKIRAMTGKSDEDFRKVMREGPFFDQGQAGAKFHGRDVHAIMRDYEYAAIQKNMGKDTQKYYDFLSSDQGIGYWDDLNEQGLRSTFASPPYFLKTMPFGKEMIGEIPKKKPSLRTPSSDLAPEGRLERPKFTVDEVYKNADLEDAEKVDKFDQLRQEMAKANKIKLTPYTPSEKEKLKKLLEKIHSDGGEVYHLTTTQKKNRIRILKEAGYTDDEIRLGMDAGIFGQVSSETKPAFKSQQVVAKTAALSSSKISVAEKVELPPVEYKTFALRDEFVGENLVPHKDSGKKITYLTEKEREASKAQFKNGKIYDSRGQPIDTKNSKTARSNGRMIYAMDKKGNIYLSSLQKKGEFHHSSLLGGEPAAAAGEIEIHNGKIKYITNESGHYKPDDELTLQFINQLEREGIDVSDFKLELFSEPGGRLELREFSETEIIKNAKLNDAKKADKLESLRKQMAKDNGLPPPKPLTKKQIAAITKVHKDGGKVFELTVTQKKNRIKILKEAGYTDDEIRLGMDAGIFGLWSKASLDDGKVSKAKFQEAYAAGQFEGANKYIYFNFGTVGGSYEIIAKGKTGRLLVKKSSGEVSWLEANMDKISLDAVNTKFFQSLETKKIKYEKDKWKGVKPDEYKYSGLRTDDTEVKLALAEQPKFEDLLLYADQKIQSEALKAPVNDLAQIDEIQFSGQHKDAGGTAHEKLQTMDPKIHKTLNAVYNAGVDEKRFRNYMGDLIKDTIVEMRKSRVSRVQKAYANGDFDYNTMIKVLNDRARSRGIKLKATKNGDYKAFREMIRSGGFLDQAFNRSTHGRDAHLIQLDYSYDLVKQNMDGDTQAYFNYLATDEGVGFWSDLYDTGATRTLGSPETMNVLVQSIFPKKLWQNP